MAKISEIDVATLRDWINQNQVVVIDVRQPEEFSGSRIDGAILLPLGSFSADDLPDFSGKHLVFQCRSGGRSLTACGAIAPHLNDDVTVYNLRGGILAWAAAGYDILSGD